MLLVLAGFPEPVVNHSVEIGGVERYRLDLAYVDEMVAIEYDGRWHDRPEQRLRDETRRRRLRELGWEVVVVTADHLYAEPEALLARVLEVALRHGVQCPRRIRDDYRRYYLPAWSVPAPTEETDSGAFEAEGA